MTGQATVKGNWIHSATIQYIKQLHPGVWEEAQAAARRRWTDEHPDDPWRGHATREAVQWTPTSA